MPELAQVENRVQSRPGSKADLELQAAVAEVLEFGQSRGNSILDQARELAYTKGGQLRLTDYQIRSNTTDASGKLTEKNIANMKTVIPGSRYSFDVTTLDGKSNVLGKAHSDIRETRPGNYSIDTTVRDSQSRVIESTHVDVRQAGFGGKSVDSTKRDGTGKIIETVHGTISQGVGSSMRVDASKKDGRGIILSSLHVDIQPRIGTNAFRVDSLKKDGRGLIQEQLHTDIIPLPGSSYKAESYLKDNKGIISSKAHTSILPSFNGPFTRLDTVKTSSAGALVEKVITSLDEPFNRKSPWNPASRFSDRK